MTNEQGLVEEWRTVVGYANYEVSSAGRVISIPRNMSRGGLMKQWLRDGYPTVCLYPGGLRSGLKFMLVHKLVAEAFIGPCPPGQQVRHLNGDRTDGRSCNLAYGTTEENTADKFIHGSVRRGEECHSAKLSAEDVAFIRAAKGRRTQLELAQQFGVARSTVQRAQSGQYWKQQP